MAQAAYRATKPSPWSARFFVACVVGAYGDWSRRQRLPEQCYGGPLSHAFGSPSALARRLCGVVRRALVAHRPPHVSSLLGTRARGLIQVGNFVYPLVAPICPGHDRRTLHPFHHVSRLCALAGVVLPTASFEQVDVPPNMRFVTLWPILNAYIPVLRVAAANVHSLLVC